MGYIVFFFNQHCNPGGFRPDQLSLSILNRKVFTEYRCQRHVKPPTCWTSDQNVPTPATRCPSRLKRRERTPAAEGRTMGEKLPRILPKVVTSTSLLGSFTCRKITTWDRLYFPSEGRHAEDFFARKNPTASAGFEPANFGTKGQNAHFQTTETVYKQDTCTPKFSVAVACFLPGQVKDLSAPLYTVKTCRRSFLVPTNSFNLLKPNDIYMCRTAALTPRRYILNIYSTNMHTEYFKHAA